MLIDKIIDKINRLENGASLKFVTKGGVVITGLIVKGSWYTQLEFKSSELFHNTKDISTVLGISLWRPSGTTITIDASCIKDSFGLSSVYFTERKTDIEWGKIDEFVHHDVGSDPELFLRSKETGKIIPSADISGLPLSVYDKGKIVPDGFQVELNPEPDSCRQVSARNIAYLIRDLDIFAQSRDVVLDFSQGVVVDDETFESSSSKAKRFGCTPSLNVHEKFEVSNGKNVKFRSGAGHIHLSYNKGSMDEVDLVKNLDAVLGNTLVLIDRDPAAKKRREYYGRAGEYRQTKYGIEYRVPSNIWLRDQVLWSMVVAFARLAMEMTKRGMKLDVDTEFVRNAINNNDYDDALTTFDKLVTFVKNNVGHNTYDEYEYDSEFDDDDICLPICPNNIDSIRNFFTSPDPLRHFSTSADDIVRGWTRQIRDFQPGFESFISSNY